MKGLRRSAIPSEPATPTNEELLAKGFEYGVRSFPDIRDPGPRRPRMAGDLLAIDLVEPGVQPEPYITGTMLREGLRGNVPTPRDLNSSIR
jgi:hypothetical protein